MAQFFERFSSRSQEPVTVAANNIVESRDSISYFGIRLPKAQVSRSEFVPDPRNYADYKHDKVSLELERQIATSFALNEPLLLEGGTSIGKNTAASKMAADLGYEVHYVNLNGLTEVDDFMGRYVSNPRRKSAQDPEYIFVDGAITAGLRQESGKIKVIFLDELNAASPSVLIRLHSILDALERDGNVVLSEDASQLIPVNKQKTKIIAAMNTPGKGYLERQPIDPALLRRFIYSKLPSEMPDDVFDFFADALIGSLQTVQLTEQQLPSRDKRLMVEELQTIKGFREIWNLYKEFHKGAKKLRSERIVAKDQSQPFTFDDRVEPRRVRDYILTFYNGNITQTMQDAVRFLYRNKLESKADREKLDEAIALLTVTSGTAFTRRSLGNDTDFENN